jgi:hypothetical protein
MMYGVQGVIYLIVSGKLKGAADVRGCVHWHNRTMISLKASPTKW